ncbi:hypothetical protein AVEN_75664-1, partial [Araneus ventricosus]
HAMLKYITMMCVKIFSPYHCLQNRTPSLTPVPVTIPVTERFDGQDTELYLVKKKI